MGFTSRIHSYVQHGTLKSNFGGGQNLRNSTPRASKVHCSINGLENSSSPKYSKVQHLFGIAVGLFSAGVGLFSATVGLRKSPPLAKKSPTPIEKSPPLAKKVLLRLKKVLL